MCGGGSGSCSDSGVRLVVASALGSGPAYGACGIRNRFGQNGRRNPLDPGTTCARSMFFAPSTLETRLLSRNHAF